MTLMRFNIKSTIVTISFQQISDYIFHSRIDLLTNVGHCNHFILLYIGQLRNTFLVAKADQGKTRCQSQQISHISDQIVKTRGSEEATK